MIQIEACDCIIAVSHQMGLDTSWEMGFAHWVGQAVLLDLQRW